MSRIGIDVTGKKFGLLTAIKVVTRDKFGHLSWLCQCDCGKTKSVSVDSLTRGLTTSCGCFRKNCLSGRATHGETSNNRVTTEYRSWSSMKARCYNENNKKFPDYGGRGITVCKRWLNSFENFLEDMGRKPTIYHTIDRFPDNDGNYEPTNCRWATDAQQNRNRRSNRWIEYGDKKMVITDWAMYFNVSFSQLKLHLKTKTFEQVFKYYEAKAA